MTGDENLKKAKGKVMAGGEFSCQKGVERETEQLESCIVSECSMSRGEKQ